MRSICTTFLAAAFAGAPLVAQATKPAPPCEPPLVWTAEVRRHVAATLVVRGVLRVDRDAIAAATEKGDYVEVTAEVHEMVRGLQAQTVTFRHFVPAKTQPERAIHPTPDELLALDGQDRVVFLTVVNGVRYLVDNDGNSVEPPEREVLAGLKQREVLHRRLLRTPLTLEPRRQTEVAAILKRIVVDRDRQRDAFAALEQLGCAALPEIVAAMDDRRQLPVRELTLANHAKDAFEALRHYQPKRVIDGISAILNQLTGESFGFLANGARDEERDAAVQAWTVYAHYQLAAARASGPGNDPAKAR
jgi:hypothetical protein